MNGWRGWPSIHALAPLGSGGQGSQRARAIGPITTVNTPEASAGEHRLFVVAYLKMAVSRCVSSSPSLPCPGSSCVQRTRVRVSSCSCRGPNDILSAGKSGALAVHAHAGADGLGAVPSSSGLLKRPPICSRVSQDAAGPPPPEARRPGHHHVSLLSLSPSLSLSLSLPPPPPSYSLRLSLTLARFAAVSAA